MVQEILSRQNQTHGQKEKLVPIYRPPPHIYRGWGWDYKKKQKQCQQSTLIFINMNYVLFKLNRSGFFFCQLPNHFVFILTFLQHHCKICENHECRCKLVVFFFFHVQNQFHGGRFQFSSVEFFEQLSRPGFSFVKYSSHFTIKRLPSSIIVKLVRIINVTIISLLLFLPCTKPIQEEALLDQQWSLLNRLSYEVVALIKRAYLPHFTEQQIILSRNQ